MEVQLFADLSEGLREEIAASGSAVHVRAGEWLFRKGDLGDRLYIVRSGRLDVIDDDRSGAVLLSLGRGAAFGELALLTHGRRAASVRAVRDTELIAVTRQQFTRLLSEDGRFGLALTTTLAHQIQQGTTPERPRERRAVLTLVPMTHDVRVDEIADRFTAELSRTRRAVALRRPGDGPPTQYGQLLDRVEATHDHVVLVAGPASHGAPADAWSAFCRRQADRTIVLAPPGTAPSSLADRAGLSGCDLAVVGYRPGRSGELAPWIDEVHARAVHWIPTGAQFGDGVGRLARVVSKQAVGVVMSGGGARGYAHLGAMQALTEAGVTIDRFGGTSIGSLMSAIFACGLSPAEAIELCRTELVHNRPYGDYTLPRFALLRGRRALRMLQRLFGSVCAEELPRSWYAVSADLLSADVVVHRRGPVWQAILASVALPGLVPPRNDQGRLLVDGGLLNNMPIDVMADTDDGPVIAIDVMRRWGAKWQERHDPDAWRRTIWHHLGWKDPLPSVVETVAGASVMSSWRHSTQHRSRSALTIVPDLSRFELFDWRELDEIAAEGRRAAEASIAACPALL